MDTRGRQRTKWDWGCTPCNNRLCYQQFTEEPFTVLHAVILVRMPPKTIYHLSATVHHINMLDQGITVQNCNGMPWIKLDNGYTCLQCKIVDLKKQIQFFFSCLWCNNNNNSHIDGRPGNMEKIIINISNLPSTIKSIRFDYTLKH